MLVVRKQGGRNLNNDRYVYINVDDNPKPLAELRRLLDLNLSYLYRDAADRLLQKGNGKQALEAARRALRYAPDRAGSHATVGFLEYLAGSKETALQELRQALRIDPGFRKQFDAALRESPELRPLRDDKEFLARLFPRR
jgi:tetratricopeptide (TPR) repeat protein